MLRLETVVRVALEEIQYLHIHKVRVFHQGRLVEALSVDIDRQSFMLVFIIQFHFKVHPL